MAKNEVPTVKLRRTSAGNLRNFFFIFTVIGVASIVIVRGLQESLLLQMALPGLVVFFMQFLYSIKEKCFKFRSTR